MYYLDYIPWVIFPVLGILATLKYFGSSKNSDEDPKESPSSKSRSKKTSKTGGNVDLPSINDNLEKDFSSNDRSSTRKKAPVPQIPPFDSQSSKITSLRNKNQYSDNSQKYSEDLSSLPKIDCSRARSRKSKKTHDVKEPLLKTTAGPSCKEKNIPENNIPAATDLKKPSAEVIKTSDKILSHTESTNIEVQNCNSTKAVILSATIPEPVVSTKPSVGLSSVAPCSESVEELSLNEPCKLDSTSSDCAISQGPLIRQTETRKLASFSMMGDKNVNSKVTKVSKLETKPSSREQCALNNVSSATSSSSEQQLRTQVRILSLNHGEHLDSTIFRLEKGFVLQFRRGPSLFGKKVNVFTNYPSNSYDDFERDKYHRLAWKSDSGNKGDDTALYVNIDIQKAGSFHFFFTYDERKDMKSAEGSGYFLVDPIITRGQNNEQLTLNCIQCQTVMTKCLGPLCQWEDRLRVTKESGYNMIHFTPVQELGGSRSGYSLANQLKLNPDFNSGKKSYSMADLHNIIAMMNKEWKIVSLTDIVLNHTANESSWLVEHPESTFNMITAPHLRPAYLIDRALHHFSLEISENKWEMRGIPKKVHHEHHLQAIRNALSNEVLPKVRVEQFFQVNVNEMVKKFETLLDSSPVQQNQCLEAKNRLQIIQDPKFVRNSSTVSLTDALIAFNIHWSGVSDEDDRKRRSALEFRNYLECLNQKKKNEIENHLQQAVNCTLGTISYERLQNDGPKVPEVTKKHPLSAPYFTHHGPDTNLEEEEILSMSDKSCYLMAHNGWVMGDDALKNFAELGSNVYIRRELISWGDSVKLRYGKNPDDSPYLWDHMKRYVEETAKIFHGIRLDNCHSTPIHVAEYLLDCARRVRPDLYVIAELFTNSTRTDNLFVNRLGINSLIREAMSAPDSHEEGRLVYLYGGEPVGAFMLPPVRPLVPAVAHAIFLDITHDNKSPCEVRTAWDMLPSSALVSMASCATGSNRGYDEIVPHHIHVVDEERKYCSWSDQPKTGIETVNKDSGIIRAKKFLNDLHFELGHKGFTQVYVDQVTEHIVTVTRHNPVTHESVVLVSYTSFRPPASIHHDYISPLKVQGKFKEIIFEFSLKVKDRREEHKKYPGKHVKDASFINGVDDLVVEIKNNLQPSESSLVKQISPVGSDTTELEYTSNFRPGCVLAIRLNLLPAAQEAIDKVRSILGDFNYQKKISEMSTRNKKLLDISRKLSLSNMNRILFRCDQEERDEGRGWGAYSVEKTGSFVYCGLQGLISSLCSIRVNNDLGHPICGNLRDGDWLMDYVANRLKLEKSTKDLGLWFEELFGHLKKLPRYLIPCYFDSIVTVVYLSLINQAWSNMSKFVSDGSDFVRALSLCSIQFCGVVKSALLPTLSPSLAPPRPPTFTNDEGRSIEASITLAAGLPHFSTGYMRNWGRDTFIALPGNLLITGRYAEARWIILAFAGTMRHGLMPNLLDGGAKARFNCRDSVWFWLYSIVKYVACAPEGHLILKDKVSRLFPKDDSDPQPPGANDQPLEQVIQEALQTHFKRLKFRERNAGLQIDSQMVDEGFNNEIGVHLETGFPFGGNVNNCGTWMDKMGSSEIAGNKGVPSTPRDGSAVEIVGLCKAVLHFLHQMHKEGKFSYNEVTREDASGNQINWTYKFWETKILANFEKYFWINDTPVAENEPTKDLINRRGIYKDVYGSSQPWTDYQLRCNFPIAIAAAPDLVNPKHAWIALNNVEKILLGPLGIKTLDPTDWKYRGNYDNANDSNDASVARGANYHQGPEWVWPVGWFMRAKLLVASRLGVRESLETMDHVRSLLSAHFSHISSSPWRSIPELTNSNGSYCADSNPAQSWSTGCVLEVLWELDELERRLNS